MTINKKILASMCALTLSISSFASNKILQIKGSDTILNVSQSIAENYMQNNKEAKIAVVGGGSGVGISSLINGTADIAMSSRDIKKSEIDAASAKGITIKEVVLGHDGITIIVNKTSKIKDISTSNLAKIYRGEITNWKEIGGDDAPIVVLSRDSSSGTHDFFKEHIIREGNSKGSQEFGIKTLYLPSNEAIKQEINQNPNAIGYVGMGYVDNQVTPLTVDGIAPTAENVLSKKYSISREVYWITKQDMSDVAKGFIDYALSNDGQNIVKEEGFVPVK